MAHRLAQVIGQAPAVVEREVVDLTYKKKPPQNSTGFRCQYTMLAFSRPLYTSGIVLGVHPRVDRGRDTEKKGAPLAPFASYAAPLHGSAGPTP